MSGGRAAIMRHLAQHGPDVNHDYEMLQEKIRAEALAGRRFYATRNLAPQLRDMLYADEFIVTFVPGGGNCVISW